MTAMDIAIALIQHPTEETILIAQRRSDVPLPNLWEFPGGKCLPGESLPECACRETWEETGIKVQIMGAWPPVAHTYATHTVTLHPFICRAETPVARALQNQCVAWVAPCDLMNYPFPEANAPLLERLCRTSLTPPANFPAAPEPA